MARALRIFCAEDEPLLGEIIVRVFRTRGHEVELATNGAEAWQRLAARVNLFDAIISDHHMPGMTGTGLVARLRAAGFAGRIVIYSSSLTEEVVAQYRVLGVDALVTKASRPEQLILAVERAHSDGR